MRRQAVEATSPPAGPPRIILTVEIDDGSLKSQVSVSVAATADEKQRAVQRWLEVMLFGLKQHGSAVDITISEPIP